MEMVTVFTFAGRGAENSLEICIKFANCPFFSCMQNGPSTLKEPLQNRLVWRCGTRETKLEIERRRKRKQKQDGRLVRKIHHWGRTPRKTGPSQCSFNEEIKVSFCGRGLR